MSERDLVELPTPRIADWLTRPVRRNRATYAKVVVAAVVINLFALLASLFTMTVYDRVLPGRAIESLVALTIGFAIVMLFDFLLKMLRAYFVDHAGAQIDQEMGQKAFEQLVAIRMDRRRGATGQVAGTMRELETLRDFFTSATLVALVDVPFTLVTLIVIWLIGGPVVLVPALLIPLVIVTGLALQPALERLTAQMLGESLSKQAILVEALGAIETVKATGAGPMLARRWHASVAEHAAVSLKQRLISAIGTTFAGSAGTICSVGVVVVGVFLIMSNSLTMGGLIACSILAGRALAPLGQVSALLARINATRTAYRQIDALMSEQRDGPVGQGLSPGRAQGAVAFRNVSYTYPGAAEKALDGVSFSLDPGERVALLGRVGSGKSTIARLLLGLNTAQEGHVLIDGAQIGQLEPAALRAAIGAVLQDPVLFTGTVRDNITLGRAEIDDAELIRAADVSGTHQFMARLVNGYDRVLADRGEGLSGGQRQSIAIARALAGRPPILVMDEPTSAMDMQTEDALLGRLQAELAGRTLLLVTHRPTLLKLVDRVIVVADGRIVADGPRDAVLARLARKQDAA